MNDGMKAVLYGVTAGLATSALCAIGFGVLGGDEAFNSSTVRASFGLVVSITAFFSVKAVQVLSHKSKSESVTKIDETK